MGVRLGVLTTPCYVCHWLYLLLLGGRVVEMDAFLKSRVAWNDVAYEVGSIICLDLS